ATTSSRDSPAGSGRAAPTPRAFPIASASPDGARRGVSAACSGSGSRRSWRRPARSPGTCGCCRKRIVTHSGRSVNIRPVALDDVTTAFARFFLQEDLNFLVTNRIPRRALTRLLGWYSAIESPRLTRWSIRTWELFADDLRLDEAKESSFASLQEC